MTTTDAPATPDTTPREHHAAVSARHGWTATDTDRAVTYRHADGSTVVVGYDPRGYVTTAARTSAPNGRPARIRTSVTRALSRP